MLLEVDNVTKSFGAGPEKTDVLRGVSLSLDDGQSLALTGESGSGKSTLLHLIAGLDTVDGGEIRIDGIALNMLNDTGRAALRRDTVGLVFQQFNLIPSLTVRENVAFQARLAGRYDAGWTDRLLDRLGLKEHAGKYPEQLSGGQQQRVATGRTLAAKPPLILADEPTGNLDEETGDKVFSLMTGLAAETGAALLVVTHSERLAARLDRRLRLALGNVA